MLIIGERINTTRKALARAVEEKEADPILREAIEQVEAGARMLDVNCGTFSTEAEPERLAWLVDIVQAATGVPLCIDSPNPAALTAALAVHQGKPMINSISGEKRRYESILPLVKKYRGSVVALGMDDRGIPQENGQALEVGRTLVESLLADGIPLDDVYFDPLIRSLATNPSAVVGTLELMRTLGSEFPGLHFVSGLSNVSYGLPERRHLNRAFVVLCVGSGLDAVIMDPLDRTLGALVYAAEALMNKDRFCLNYIEAYHRGKLKS